MMYYPMMFDYTYILVLIGVALCLIAQGKVKSTYSKYSQVRSVSGLNGAQVAQRILMQNGLNDVSVGQVAGSLTDHYDPKAKRVNLSEAVYSSTSVAAISVAAHECGHAVQDSVDYLPLKLRSALVPAANFGAKISWPLIFIGILMGWNKYLIDIGIILFMVVVAFHFITLPVELNASSRALAIMESSGILQGEENDFAKKVLGAAALTYIASAASMALQLARLVILNRRRR